MPLTALINLIPRFFEKALTTIEILVVSGSNLAKFLKFSQNLAYIGRDHIYPGNLILDIFTFTLVPGNRFEVRPMPRMPQFHEIFAAVSSCFEAISQINRNSKNVQD